MGGAVATDPVHFLKEIEAYIRCLGSVLRPATGVVMN